MRYLIFLLLLIANALIAEERVIAMSPAISEILFALKRGDQVVGVSDYATYPAAVKQIETIGGYFQPNLEKIISLAPTQIIGQRHHQKVLTQLKRLGLPVTIVDLFTLQQITTTITRLGQLTDAEPAAAALVAAIENAKLQAPKASGNPSVLIVFGLAADLRDGIYVAGHDLYYEEIITLCGASNAYQANFSGQPVLTYEGIVGLNPDIVIILHSPLTNPNDTAPAKAVWAALPIKAARKGRIAILDAPHLAIPSQRVARTITVLCQTIAADQSRR